MDLRNTFLAGKMNLDADHRLMRKGEYGPAENIRVANSEGSDVGAIEKTLSNTQLTNLNLGDNAITLGSLKDEFDEKLYWAVKSDSGCYVIEYTISNDAELKILEDTRSGALNVLGFDFSKLMQMVLIIDSDNNNRLLAFTDDNTQPKLINVERAKTYGANGFNEEMILLIKKPPIYAPTITLGNTATEDENNIEEKFLVFGYRYKYLDGEYSALSPCSEIAFKAKTFEYDYSTGSNESMINAYNKVGIAINTGSDLVTDIEVVFKESGSINLYLIEAFNKADKSWSDNTTESFDFSNNKTYLVLAEKELYRLYDNVPLLAKAIAIINNRIVFGDYTENYDIVDCVDAKINIDITAEKVSTPIVSGVPTKSLKSVRDYEVAPVYLDAYGRMTTPLPSENNTVYIPNSDSVNQNQIKVTLKHKAPCFAKFYRIFIKQNKTDYESISPIIFYQDGGYRWIKLEHSDKDKIKEGQQLIVKSDSTQILQTLVKVKVLEVTRQEKNFLQPEDVTDKIVEKSGLYFKIKPKGFRLNTDDFENFEIDTYHNARRRYHNVLRGSSAIVHPAHYYGDTLDDLTTGGSCTLGQMVDARYIVQVDLAAGTDTFKWSDDNGNTWTNGVTITGASQSLSNGITVTFGATTGHSVLDEWNFYVRGELESSDSRAYGWFRTQGDKYATMTSSGHTLEDEVIENGAVIDLVYDEWNRGDVNWTINAVSSAQYDNIAEWYYREDIGNEILTAFPGYDLTKIFFMRGVLEKDGDGNANYLDYDSDGYMTMVVESQNSQSSSKWVYVRANTTLFQSDGTTRLLFETDPIDENTDKYQEIGQTYVVDANQNHLGNGGSDVNQTDIVDAEVILPAFNCFAWGNAFESYKIKDFFNAKTMKMDTRPSTTIENYRRNRRIATFTYSNVYEQSTNYNALNEFNLGLINWKDLDDKYGAIQAMVTWDNDLDVWQEDKVTKVLYDKAVIYNQDGSSNLAKSNKILDGVIPYSGEYGISQNPEGLTVFGNYVYWPDAKRGVVLRKGQSGIEIISNFGMRDFFKDAFRDGDTTKILGGYDPYFGQYIISLNDFTLTFDEKVKGWTSFHSYLPEHINRVNNRLYTFKDGELWLHNSDEGYCNYYCQQFGAKITTVFNENPDMDKIFKTLAVEGDFPWSVTIKTNLTESTIYSKEFNQRESRWYAYMRRNEDQSNLNGVAQGLGDIMLVNGSEISFNAVSNIVSIGDKLYQMNGSNQELIGVITDIADAIITVATIITTPIVGRFSFGKKDSRIEGAAIRGYYLEATLEDNNLGANELFAVRTNAVKSFL